MWQDICTKTPGYKKQQVLCAWIPTKESHSWSYEVLIHWPDGIWTDTAENEIEPSEMPDVYMDIESLGKEKKAETEIAKMEEQPFCFIRPYEFEHLQKQVRKEDQPLYAATVWGMKLEDDNVPLYSSPRLYKVLPKHPMFYAFIRAFWRRINAHKNDFENEIPEEMPVQFRASMETALLVFDKDGSDA
jgi:hypothetical protein